MPPNTSLEICDCSRARHTLGWVPVKQTGPKEAAEGPLILPEPATLSWSEWSRQAHWKSGGGGAACGLPALEGLNSRPSAARVDPGVNLESRVWAQAAPGPS